MDLRDGAESLNGDDHLREAVAELEERLDSEELDLFRIIWIEGF